LDRPLTCVSYADAAQHCASKGKRLPSMGEWSIAAPAIAMCQDGARACPLFEWSSDAAQIPGDYRQTRGPSWRHGGLSAGRNPVGAKNDDLGFRCASDPPR
jgi:hypothetical protein